MNVKQAKWWDIKMQHGLPLTKLSGESSEWKIILQQYVIWQFDNLQPLMNLLYLSLFIIQFKSTHIDSYKGMIQENISVSRKQPGD